MDDPFAQPANTGKQPEIYLAVAVEEPKTSSTGVILRIFRLAMVFFACLSVFGLTFKLWTRANAELKAPPGDRYLKTPEQEKAKADLAAVEAELRQERDRLERMKERWRHWPEQFTGSTGPAATSPFLAEVSRLLAQGGELQDYFFMDLRRLAPAPGDGEAAREQVRQAMQFGAAQAGTVCRIVLILKDDQLRGELLASLESADEAKCHYRLYETEGLVDLLEQASPDEAQKLLPVVVELAAYMKDPARQRLAAYLAADAGRAASAASLAFDRNSAVRDMVRPHVADEALWQAAFEALKQDPAMASAAASWIADQEVETERQEQVVVALLPHLWITPDGKEFPALATLARWGNEQNAAALEEVGRAAGAERVAGDICRLLAKWSEERLAKVIQSRLGSLEWNVAAAPAMRDEPIVARAVKAALRDAAPQDAHGPYIEMLFFCATPDDATWLREYQIRLRGIDLRRGPELDRRIEQILSRQAEAGKLNE